MHQEALRLWASFVDRCALATKSVGTSNKITGKTAGESNDLARAKYLGFRPKRHKANGVSMTINAMLAIA